MKQSFMVDFRNRVRDALERPMQGLVKRFYGDEFLQAESQQNEINKLRAVLKDMIQYPPSADGIPILDVDHIVYAFQEIVTETFRASGMTYGDVDRATPCFANTYMPVIERLISYYHLLPASEYNHHNEVGGLLAHSLEVGLMSLRLAKNKKVKPIGLQDIERLRQPRWEFAAWTVGVMHDCGKIISDINVISLDAKGVIWQPQVHDLYQWARENNVRRYEVVWNNRRIMKGHDIIAPLMIMSMTNEMVKRWLFDPTDDLSAPIIRALSGYHHKSDYLEDCVRSADHLSAERDLKTQYHKLLGKRRSGIEQSIINAIRECRKTRWKKINADSSRLFIVHDEAYIKFPEAIEDIYKTINEMQVNALPIDAKAVLSIMEASAIVIRNHEQSHNSLLLKKDKDGKQIKINVVRLNYVGIAYNTDVAPPSLTDCQLVLSAHGERLEINKSGATQYQEPANNPHKTAFNFDGFIEPEQTLPEDIKQAALGQPNQKQSQPKTQKTTSTGNNTKAKSSNKSNTTSKSTPSQAQTQTKANQQPVSPSQPAPPASNKPRNGTKGIQFKNMPEPQPQEPETTSSPNPATEYSPFDDIGIGFKPDATPPQNGAKQANQQSVSGEDNEQSETTTTPNEVPSQASKNVSQTPPHQSNERETPSETLNDGQQIEIADFNPSSQKKKSASQPNQVSQNNTHHKKKSHGTKNIPADGLAFFALFILQWRNYETPQNVLCCIDRTDQMLLSKDNMIEFLEENGLSDAEQMVNALLQDRHNHFKVATGVKFHGETLRTSRNVVVVVAQMLGVTLQELKRLLGTSSSLGRRNAPAYLDKMRDRLDLTPELKHQILGTDIARINGWAQKGKVE